MRCRSIFRALLLLSGFFVSTAVFAQSQMNEIAPLPTTLSTEQLQSLSQLSPAPVPAPPQEISYRGAVQKLGVDKHRFVRCDLLNGKVRTGAITRIEDDRFLLKDGILSDRWIPYSHLKAAPRPVAAVGTHLKNGLAWTGLVSLCVVLLPFCLLSTGV